MSQKNHPTSWLLLLLLLLGSKPIAIAQTLLQRNYSGLPDGAQQTLHSEASRLTDLVNAYFRTTGFQVLDVGLYDLSINMQGEQSFDVAFQTADAEVQGQAIPAARQPILRSNLNLNAYLLMVWQVAADGRSLKLRWKLRLPDNGTIPPAELLELEGILTGMGSQVAEQQMASLGLGKWAEAAGAGVKKIADLLERKMRGEEVLVGEVYLTKIEFKGFIPIENNKTPQWTLNKPGDQPSSHPLCYARTTPMQLFPELACPSNLSQGRIRLKIKYGNIESLPIDLTYDDSSQRLKAKSAGIAFIIDTKVAYYNAFKIEWLVSFGKSDEWIGVGTSSHELFIVLAGQKDAIFDELKLEILYFGCTQGKNTDNERDFIEAIWAPFKSKSLNLKLFKPKEQPIPFTYYRTPGQGCNDIIQNQIPIELEDTTIVNGKAIVTKEIFIDGECGAFANLFSDILLNQGVENNVKFTYINEREGYEAFLIQRWSFEFQSFPELPFPYRNIFQANYFNMGNGKKEATPRSKNNAYTWIASPGLLSIVDLPGLEGQNVINPYSDFKNHVFVMIGEKVYDPSYGLIFASFAEWANQSIAGFVGTFDQANTKETPNIEGLYYFKATPSVNPLSRITPPQ